MSSRGFIIFRCGEFLTVLTFLVKKSTMRLSRVCVYVYVWYVCMHVFLFYFIFLRVREKKNR